LARPTRRAVVPGDAVHVARDRRARLRRRVATEHPHPRHLALCGGLRFEPERISRDARSSSFRRSVLSPSEGPRRRWGSRLLLWVRESSWKYAPRLEAKPPTK